MSEHPSPLALDRYALGANPNLHPHVESCDQCRAYVAHVSRDPGPAPVLRPWWGRWLVLAAAAATVLVFAMPRVPYVGTKGAPSVVVWVRTEKGVHLWSGETLHPGDSVRLELTPGPYDEVEVRSAGTVLYRGALSDGGALPVSWTLDRAPGPEVLHITLHGPSQPWSTTLEIPKEVP